jgi:hypothetical protein
MMKELPVEILKTDEPGAPACGVTEEPTLADRLGCACYVLAHGADYPGIWTTRRLMWPHTNYTTADVATAAAKLVASVGIAWLTTAPQPLIDQISTGLAEHLSFVLDDGLPDDGNLVESPAPEVPR